MPQEVEVDQAQIDAEVEISDPEMAEARARVDLLRAAIEEKRIEEQTALREREREIKLARLRKEEQTLMAELGILPETAEPIPTPEPVVTTPLPHVPVAPQFLAPTDESADDSEPKE